MRNMANHSSKDISTAYTIKTASTMTKLSIRIPYFFVSNAWDRYTRVNHVGPAPLQSATERDQLRAGPALASSSASASRDISQYCC